MDTYSKIRKLRKKLRQIEKLEDIERDLTDEEVYKVCIGLSSYLLTEFYDIFQKVKTTIYFGFRTLSCFNNMINVSSSWR